MFTRFTMAAGLALMLALVLSSTVMAGGWAVVTLDRLPGEIGVGQTVKIGFMVRQHGVTPLGGLTPVVTAELDSSAAKTSSLIKPIRVEAQAEGKEGHYVAEFSLPQAGQWNWSIDAFTFKSIMPALVVGDAPIQQAAAVPAPSSPYWYISVLGIGICLAGLFFTTRRRSGLAIALAVIGLGVGLAALFAATRPAAQASAESQPPASQAALVAAGEDLFVAKGCVTCHVNSRLTKTSGHVSIESGPNLTNVALSEEYLQSWLKDPQALKPNTDMPNLDLKQDEIEALIAFLKQGGL